MTFLTHRRGRPRLEPVEMTANLTLGSVIGARMKEMDWTIRDASRISGVSYRHLQRILHEEGYSPHGDTIDKLAKLGIAKSTLALAAFCTA